ncbi:MAG: glycosyltransferase family 1 protein [Flavipsychrobacter sp.]|nr:glycosyltransferase family 1 protein [Flavipsychrobacter sp.]
MLSVTYFYREPRKTGVSIEGIFKLVKECLKGKATITDVYCDAGSSRLQSILSARRSSAKINHITGDVNFLAIGLKGKTILTIHDFGFYENPVHSKVVKFIYRMFWFSLPLKRVAIVTVVSEFTRQKLVSYFHFPESRIRVIPDPVKPIFKYSKRVANHTTPVILMMGTGKHKNLDNLIEAAKGINCHIDIIGWPAADELEKIKQYNISYTVYNGLTDAEVYERYIACDILFMASFYEGFGMPIIEAQAVGRAVITSNIGAMKEVGERSAILVDPANPQEIKNAITSLADETLYNKVVAAGRENAARYDYRAIADQYLEVYKELN